ncbi:hypothetical protein GB928_000045 [Shinella curvata]|uniref:Uncharacterized protein n=1 Tax=Shinella curvata TaxID=1817964 RepID=A0ABT8X740_9HYPH|nr:hypothetical protein [Shinella curvata]MCJ8052489.1 hypothetical protein [Shinella curvata]MDO6119562.1 hypothetical protein [Shinella curvata]
MSVENGLHDDLRDWCFFVAKPIAKCNLFLQPGNAKRKSTVLAGAPQQDALHVTGVLPGKLHLREGDHKDRDDQSGHEQRSRMEQSRFQMSPHA